MQTKHAVCPDYLLSKTLQICHNIFGYETCELKHLSHTRWLLVFFGQVMILYIQVVLRYARMCCHE